MVYASHVFSRERDSRRNQADQRYAPTQIPPAADRSPAGGGSKLHLSECRSCTQGSMFGAMVSETASRMRLEPRALAVRTLLHLPRVASQAGWVTKWQVQRELRIGSEQLKGDVWSARTHIPRGKFPLQDLSFERIDSSRALPILTSLHYLRSARPNSIFFALVDPIDRLPVTLCGISPLQWKCVENQLHSQFAIQPKRVWDVSRLYSLDNAPANAISLLLSRVRIYLRRRMPSVDLLATTVDPNLGFTGSSCRAANWQQWMTVKPRPYLYENGRYVSPRQLNERFGTSSLVVLEEKYPGRFEQSRPRLLNSLIYCCSINEKTKVVPAQEMRCLHR
jgi:hypothetical protein